MIIHVTEEVFKKGYFLFKLARVSFECVKVLCSISFYVLQISAKRGKQIQLINKRHRYPHKHFGEVKALSIIQTF